MPSPEALAVRRAHVHNLIAEVISELGAEDSVYAERVRSLYEHNLLSGVHADHAASDMLAGLAEIIADQDARIRELEDQLRATAPKATTPKAKKSTTNVKK